jgi:hypothetical protein
MIERHVCTGDTIRITENGVTTFITIQPYKRLMTECELQLLEKYNVKCCFNPSQLDDTFTQIINNFLTSI